MEEFKLKIILSALGGVVFSLLFIVLAFALPIKKKEITYNKPKGKLEIISHSLRKD